MHEQRDGTDRFTIRVSRPDDRGDILAIINAAAEAYRTVIPADRWREPYMPADALAAEIDDSVAFTACTVRDRVVGVMGVQRRANADLIRHAYVSPEWQGRGVGSVLLKHLCDGAERQILIGTWQAATWAIRFYERHGFACVDDDSIAPLLRAYWKVPERQIETSVVLAAPPLSHGAALRLLAEALDPARDG